MNLNTKFYLWFFLFFISSLLLQSCEQKKNSKFLMDRKSSLKKPFKTIGKGTDNFSDDAEKMSCTPNPDKLVQSNCDKGFLCVRSMFDIKNGHCLQECGQVIDGKLEKRSNCPTDRKCMLLKSEDLSSLGMFCLIPGSLRDSPCEAAFDKEACGQGLSCLPTITLENEHGKIYYAGNLCKKECIRDSDCESPERCLYPSYARIEPETNEKSEKRFIACEVSACEKKDAPCACDRSSLFYCKAIISGLDRGYCVRSLGVCEKPSPE